LSPDPNYPKYENGIIVPDPRFPTPIDPNKYPMWVHKDGIPSEESILVNNPAQEVQAKLKLMPPKQEQGLVLGTGPETSDQNITPSSKPKSKSISI